MRREGWSPATCDRALYVGTPLAIINIQSMRATSRAIALLMVVGAVVAALSGCSDDEDALPRDEYVRQVNGLCAEAVSATEGLISGVFAELAASGRLPETPTPAETQAVYKAVLPAARESNDVIGEMLGELRALAAPGELADDAEELWDAYEDRLEIGLRRIEEATVDTDAAVALEADDLKPFTPENTRAAEIGFAACRFE